MLSSTRLRFFEIDDQPWFPSRLRYCVQSVLTLAWNIRVPIFQRASAAAHAGDILLRHIEDLSAHHIIDIAAGAGGPVPGIESRVNQVLQTKGEKPVQFLLTDLHPHLRDWKQLKQVNKNIDFVARPVDATAVRGLTNGDQKECRMFNLAFHHLNDQAATAALSDAVENADAIVIFELQERSLTSFVNIIAGGLLSIYLTPLYFWSDPIHLFFSCIIPIVPFVIIFDGLISSLRTRTANEVLNLLPRKYKTDSEEWTFKSGKEFVLPPFGYLHWFVGVRGCEGAQEDDLRMNAHYRV